MKKAQSILEYVITLTVIVGAIIAASGYMRGRIQAGLNSASDSIVRELNENPSIAGTVAGTGGGPAPSIVGSEGGPAPSIDIPADYKTPWDNIQLWPQYPGSTVTPYYQLPPAVVKPYIDPGAGTEYADPLGEWAN